MKKLLAAIFLAVPLLSFAGTSRPPDEPTASAHPCMIRINAETYINANAVTMIRVFPDPALYQVYIYLGNHNTRILVPPNKVDKYVADLTTVMKNCGKGT